jgi:hypothetical protein
MPGKLEPLGQLHRGHPLMKKGRQRRPFVRFFEYPPQRAILA